MLLKYSFTNGGKVIVHLRRYSEPLFTTQGENMVSSGKTLGANTDWIATSYIFETSKRQTYAQVSTTDYIKLSEPDGTSDVHMFVTLEKPGMPNVKIAQAPALHRENGKVTSEWNNHKRQSKQTILTANGKFTYSSSYYNGDEYQCAGACEIPYNGKLAIGWKTSNDYMLDAVNEAPINPVNAHETGTGIFNVLKPFSVTISSITPHIYDRDNQAVWFENTIGDTFLVQQVYAKDLQLGYVIGDNTIIDAKDGWADSKLYGGFLPSKVGFN